MRPETQVRLVIGIAKARMWLDALLRGGTTTIKSLAQQEGRSARSMRMLLPLAFLAPDIVRAAIAGTLPRGVGLTDLSEILPDWPEQRRWLGLAIWSQGQLLWRNTWLQACHAWFANWSLALVDERIPEREFRDRRLAVTRRRNCGIVGPGDDKVQRNRPANDRKLQQVFETGKSPLKFNDLVVELSGIEPLTSCMPCKRSPN